MSEETVAPVEAQSIKPKALAGGIDVWCAFDELVPTDQLKPNPRNPNTHPTGQVALLAKNIGYFGWRHPITVSRRSGCIVAGHGRLLAAQKLGAPLVPVDYQHFATDADELAVLVSDNSLPELAEMDDEELKKILKELDGQIDMDLTGFDASDLEQLLPPEDIDESPVPEPPDEAITQPGDIYVLGNHRLMCGDSSSPEALDRLLDGARIQLCNTDPPYNVKVEPRSNNAVAAGLSSFGESNTKPQNHHQGFDEARFGKREATHKKLRAKDRPLANDFVSDEDFDKMLRAWFGNIARVLEPGRAFYVWGGYGNLGCYPPALKESELYFSQGVIWDKEHPVLTRKDLMGAYEIAFYGWREGAAHQFFGPNNATDLWHIKKVNPQNMVHLCLHPDAEVLTEAGFRAIKSIKAGDRVFTGDGKFHDVAHVSSHRYTSEHLFRITAKGGNATTGASDNHPFLIWRPVRKKAAIVGGDVAWVRADQIKLGDYTMTPIPTEAAPDPFPELDENYWFLFGLYLAQGHLQLAGSGGGLYPVFSIHKQRQDLVERIWKQWPSTREYDPNDYNPVPHSGLTVFVFDGEASKRFQALGGRRSHGKHIAPEVFRLPHAKRLAVFQGWLNGDGCKVHDRSYYQGNTVSADLATHLCLLAESVGYRANVFSYDPPEDFGGIDDRKFKSRRRVYYLYFYERKQIAKRGSPLLIEHEGRQYSLRKIKNVEQIRYEGDVWNLSVKGNHTFQTAVGLSHNTEKPVELAVRAMTYSSRPGENVLDLFGGSGSTMIGAEQCDRKAFLMELDQPYCDVIVQRWINLGEGRTAIRLRGDTREDVTAAFVNRQQVDAEPRA